jgi:hypothetical protein
VNLGYLEILGSYKLESEKSSFALGLGLQNF